MAAEENMTEGETIDFENGPAGERLMGLIRFEKTRITKQLEEDE